MDRRLLVLALGMFALGTDNFVVAGVLPELAKHFQVGIGAAGQMTTAYALSYAIFAPVIAARHKHQPWTVEQEPDLFSLEVASEEVRPAI